MKLQLLAPVAIVLTSRVFSEIQYTISDDGNAAHAMISGLGRRLTLWDATTSPTYSQVGDYTQAQIVSRMEQLLGDNPAAVLSGLVSPAQRM
jgi:hypothetical protein